MQNKKQDIQVAVDAIVFGYAKTDGVSVLLIERKYEPFKNSWEVSYWKANLSRLR